VTSSRQATIRAFSAALALSLLVSAWTWPLTRKMIDSGDFPDHLAVATTIVEHPSLPAPHFLFFGAVAVLMMALPGLSAPAAGMTVIAVLHVATALLIGWYLRRASGEVSPATLVVAAALLVVGPILPLSFGPTQYLVGYFPPNPFHNATFTTAKPFCLWLLLIAAAAVGSDRRSDRRAGLAVGGAAAVVLTAISKPNYLTCLVPALIAYAGWRRLTHRAVHWTVVAAITLPAVAAVLLMQRLYGGKDITVEIAPFAALSYHVIIGPGLAWQLLGAIAFPIAVGALWPQLVLHRADLVLAWGAAMIGFAEGYLLGEAGTRMDHANLLVAASQGVFVLMVASAAALLSLPRAASTAEGLKRAVAWVVFALHLMGGLRHVLVKMAVDDWRHPLTYIAVAAVVIWSLATSWPRRPLVATSTQARV
jgi:hypothetical protein